VVFPGNLEFQNEDYRTKRIEEGAGFVYTLNRILEGEKEGINYDFNNLSLLVHPIGFEPITPGISPLLYR